MNMMSKSITMPDKQLASLQKDWQTTIDIMAKIINVPVGLIMRLDQGFLEVFVSSKTAENPYDVGEKELMEGSGLYCETVIKNQDQLLIPNALSDPEWQDNPDIKLNMISYLGLPINYPDGTPFGTICVLDSKENAYSQDFITLVSQFRVLIERYLLIMHQNIKIKELADRDELTNLYNRRAFCRLATKEASIAKRKKQSMCTLVIDIDNFKQINDTYGHANGDTILTDTAKALSAELRPYDILARFGGEEFVILMTGIDAQIAQQRGQQICRNIASMHTKNEYLDIPITISLGLTQLLPDESVYDAIHRADSALYKAKSAGRNRLEIA